MIIERLQRIFIFGNEDRLNSYYLCRIFRFGGELIKQIKSI